MAFGRNNSLPLTLGVMLAVAGLATGCQQARNDPSTSGAIDTGTYPNLNIKPGVANAQITAEQSNAAKAELNGAAAKNANRDASVPRDEAYLKRLAAQHDKEALRKIESGQ